MGMYPSTAVIDTFNRANEDPLNIASNGMAYAVIAGMGVIGGTNCKDVSNQLAGNGGTVSGILLNNSFSADCESAMQVPTLGAAGELIDLLVRSKDTGSILTVDSYSCRWTNVSGTDTVALYRVDNIAATLLASFNQELSAADWFGIRCIGTTIEAWCKIGSANWKRLGTATDATYAAGGFHILSVIGTTVRGDNFTGGNYTDLPWPLTVSGTMGSAGALFKQVQKVFAGTLSSSGALTKIKISLLTLAGTLPSSGAITKRVNKIFGGTLPSSGSLSKLIAKLLSGVLASAGNLSKRAATAFSGTLPSSGLLQKRPGKILVATLPSTGAIAKRVGKIIGGTLAPTGTLGNIKTVVLNLVGTLPSSGAIQKQVAKVVGGVLPSAGGLIKRAQKTLVGVMASSGALSASKLAVTYLLSIAGTLPSGGALSKQVGKSLSGTLPSVGGIAKRIGKFVGGVLGSIGSLIAQKTGGQVLAGFDLETTQTLNMEYAPGTQSMLYIGEEITIYYTEQESQAIEVSPYLSMIYEVEIL